MIIERRGRIRHLLNALATKPFVLLAGISGSGKTQLARRLAAGLAAGSKQGGRYAGVLPGGLNGASFRSVLESNGVAPGLNHSDLDAYMGVKAIQPASPGPDGISNLRETLRNRVAFLPVRPDWNNSRDIWGYFNPLTGLYYPTDAIRVALHAYLEYLKFGDQAPRHFIILDELNLARVEYYLSDLLSLMESGCTLEGDKVRIGEMASVHPFNRPLWTESGPTMQMGKADSSHEQLFVGRMKADWALAYHYLGRASPGALLERPKIDFDNIIHGADWARLAPARVTFTPNLCIIGTVNVDETTFSFAPKVLDRAFVMEFNEINFDAVCKGWTGYSSVRDDVTTLNALLEPASLHFGYRVLMEMLRYLERSAMSWEDAGDFLLTSKVLPKIRGSEALLEAVVPPALVFTITGSNDVDALRAQASEIYRDIEKVELSALLETLDVSAPRFPEAARKLHSMARQMFTTGLTSFF